MKIHLIEFSLLRSHNAGTVNTHQRHIFSIFIIYLTVKRPSLTGVMESNRQIFFYMLAHMQIGISLRLVQ